MKVFSKSYPISIKYDEKFILVKNENINYNFIVKNEPIKYISPNVLLSNNYIGMWKIVKKPIREINLIKIHKII